MKSLQFLSLALLVALPAQASLWTRASNRASRTVQRMAQRVAYKPVESRTLGATQRAVPVTTVTKRAVHTAQNPVIVASRVRSTHITTSSFMGAQALSHVFKAYNYKNGNRTNTTAYRCTMPALLATLVGTASAAQKEEKANTQGHAPTLEERQALIKAIEAENVIEIVKLVAANKRLLTIKCDTQGNGVLHYAIEKGGYFGSMNCILELIKLGADVNEKDKDGNTPLLLKIYYPDIAMALLEAGANVNAKNGLGYTALHYVTDAKIAHALIEKKANVNALNNFGQTPAHFLANCNRHDSLKAVIAAKVDLTKQDRFYDTALHYASRSPESLQIARLIIKADPRTVNIADSAGKTPLHIACEKGNHALVYDLVAAGADIHASTSWFMGKTPHDLAVANKHHGIADSLRLLEQERAQQNTAAN